MKPEEALRLLMIGPAYTQVAIKTDRAAAQLRWIRSERIEGLDTQALRDETEDYLKSFAEEMAKLS